MGTKSMDEKNLISTPEAGKLLRVTRQHIGRLIRAGLINAITIGGRWLVDRDSVLEYQAKRGGKDV